jgi:hypothetical protein
LSKPFQTKSIRDACASEARASDPEKENGVFWIDVESTDKIKVGAYSNAWSDRAIIEKLNRDV